MDSSTLFYLALAGYAVVFLRRWRKTGDAKNLRKAGALVFAITFFISLGLASDVVVYRSGEWKEKAVLFTGSLTGALLLSAGYAGWRKVYAAAGALIFAAVTAYLGNSMWHFEKVVLMAHSEKAIVKLYPGTGGTALRTFTPQQKADLAARLAATLADTDDPVLRYGALRKLSACGPAAAAALPALIERIDKADRRELNRLLTVLKGMGPAAAPAAAALSERHWATSQQGEKYAIEEALKTIDPQKTPPAGVI
jgi:hypothetical protein